MDEWAGEGGLLSAGYRGSGADSWDGRVACREEIVCSLFLTLQPHPPLVGTKMTTVNSIHRLGLVGHIEDIAVAKDQQGKKLGFKLIQALDFIAEKVGCYKCILDCSEANEGFYVKCGYKRAGLEMAHYYDGSTSRDVKSATSRQS